MPKNTIKIKRSKGMKTALSLVACFAILVASVVSVNAFRNQPKFESTQLQTYNSYDEIEKQVKKLRKYNSEGFNVMPIMPYGMSSKDDALTDVISDSVGASPEISETNIQIEGVDEADIVKTDGEYIYRRNIDESAIKIFSVDGEKVEKVGFAYIDERHHQYNEISDFYLMGDKIAVISNSTDYDEKEYSYDNYACVTVFDITDRANPKLEYSYEQSGWVVSSRMVGNIVYVVSGFNPSKDNYIPMLYGEKIPCDCIYGMPNPDSSSFVVVGAVDTQSNKSNRTKTKAVLGGAGEVFCTNNNLYVTASSYHYTPDDEKLTTSIVKISFNGLELEVAATGKINGSVLNQYAMNEKNGKLFVASTKNSGGKDINTLYVLDENLNFVSRVENFARDESIKAVRYIGDYAYVITYKQTDPLFVIDLSDEKNPKIKGSVKIDGFSTSLMPVDDNTLLGVGNYVEKGAVDGVKLVLFDISNPEKPKVKSEYEIPDSWSEAQYNIKAITMFDNKVVIPIEAYSMPTEDGSADKAGTIMFDISNGKIKMDKRYNNHSILNRTVRIDDYLYGITEMDAEIVVFKI